MAHKRHKPAFTPDFRQLEPLPAMPAPAALIEPRAPPEDVPAMLCCDDGILLFRDVEQCVMAQQYEEYHFGRPCHVARFNTEWHKGRVY